MHDLRVEKHRGFYSIYAAMIVTQNNVPGFKMSESTIRNYLKKVIDSIPPINTITFDNGSAMSNVGKLEKIPNKGREGIKCENGEIKYETRVFYAIRIAAIKEPEMKGIML